MTALHSITRRDSLRLAGAAAAAVATQSADAAPQTQPPAPTAGELTDDADVLVVGGGTAGTIAAIQAARAGAKTMLIERGSQLGGTMTVGWFAFPGLFHACASAGNSSPNRSR